VLATYSTAELYPQPPEIDFFQVLLVCDSIYYFLSGRGLFKHMMFSSSMSSQMAGFLFFLIGCVVFFVCVCHVFFIHSSIDEHSGCSISCSMNSAEINMKV
jgi:hypothetical protein